jgi:Ser-tRNA(Ala) deacylase AlaX
MPTEALFREDAYLRACEARVLSATPEAILRALNAVA